MSKVFEKVLNVRLKKYLESNTLLSDRQYGFRNCRSTDDAVHDLTNHVVKALDNRDKCVAIFLDLAKAFDTVSIPLLCSKLEKMGIRGMPLKLFQNYLENRTQCVKIGEFISDELPMKHGVPQGSILGPTLFLIYINDLCNIDLTNGKLVAFADDTALIFTASTWNQAFQDAQVGFNIIHRWLATNLLSLNVDKTKVLKFCIRKSKDVDQTIFKIIAHNHGLNNSPDCDCPKLEFSNSVRYLGVVLDDHLSFKPHIDNLAGRIRKLIYVFKHLRHVADPDTIKMVYYALCQSLLGYCITTWGGSDNTHFLKLERAQRAVLKVSTFKPFRYPTTDLYQNCKVLTVRQLFILNIILRQHSNRPSDHLFTSFKSKRRPNVIPRTHICRTTFSQKFYYFLGRFMYNKIDNILRIDSKSKYECKKLVTNWLLNFTYEDTEKLLQVVR